MPWKCCTEYASKSGKLSSGHRTGKGQFSFQSQRKAMPKNAQTTTQLPGFINMWTVNFQMFNLDLEKAEEPEIKLPTSAGSSKKQERSEKHLLLLYWLHQSLWLCGGLVARSCLTLVIPWTVACQAPLSKGFSRQEYWSGFPFPSPINCGKFLRKWEYQTTCPASWKICIQVRKQQLELDMEQQTGSK